MRGDYKYEAHHGGVIITDTWTGRTVFLQPGDDAGQFWDELGQTNDIWTDHEVCSQYFPPTGPEYPSFLGIYS